jgi:hypothetical protein
MVDLCFRVQCEEGLEILCFDTSIFSLSVLIGAQIVIIQNIF